MIEPIFRDSHHALLFAFNFSHQAYDRPLMNRLATKGSCAQANENLVGLNGAGQAGMIFSKLSKLTLLQQMIIFATYAPRKIQCYCTSSCCSGYKPNLMWNECIYEISRIAASEVLAGCVSHRVLRDGIVKRVFGGNVVLADLAYKCDVSANTATEHNQRIKRWLVGSNLRMTNREAKDYGLIEIARSRADAVLTESGMVEMKESA